MHPKGSSEHHRTRFLLQCTFSSSQHRGKKMPPVRQHTPCYPTSDVYRIQTGKYMGLQQSVTSFCSLQHTSNSKLYDNMQVQFQEESQRRRRKLHSEVSHSLQSSKCYQKNRAKFFPPSPISAGLTLQSTFITLSKGYYHCNRLSSSRPRLLNLPDKQRAMQR